MTALQPITEDAGQWVWRPSQLSPADEAAAAMERKWGIDRLPLLVSPETRARFQAAHDLRNGEWNYATEERRQALDAMMARAWAALDAEAVQRGAAPLPPACFEIALDGLPGAFAAVCLDDHHGQAIALRAKAEGRCVTVWTLAEVARVIQGASVINRIKDVFPGATVQPKRVGPLPDDEIPFPNGDDE
jgi:hypothetical protein